MKHRLEANSLSKTVDREAIFETEHIFTPFSKLDILRKTDFRIAGHILCISQLTQLRGLIFDRRPY